jgi:SAM-dependent methyltransferase
MFFTADALEQATGESVAAHRARRFAGSRSVVDLGCGIGGDTLALASIAPVIGIDRDGLRLLMARENARAYRPLHSIEWIRSDISGGGPVRADAAFVDPARRTADGRRIFDPESYEPPLSEILRWRDRFRILTIKVAPGIRDADLVDVPGEIEFVAHGSELKEAVIWLGPEFRRERRATLLPEGLTIVAEEGTDPPVRAAGSILYEPHPAVIRAHAIAVVARTLGAWQIDPSIAYLSGNELHANPFVRAWQVEAVLPFSVDRVRRHLRDLGVGRVVVKKRGSPLEPDAFIRMLRLDGPDERTVVLTRQHGRRVALICRPAP